MASRLTTFIVALIVGGTFIAGLIVGAQREDENGPVDLIITNGRVFTGAGQEFAEALAVKGNRILRVGSNREIKRMRRPQTLMLDAHGASVLPGLIDTHVRLGDAANAFSGVDLSDVATADDIQTRLAAFAETHPDADWIRGRGWSPDALPSSIPPRALLDEALPGRPAYLVSADGRTAWVNSSALVLAGITRQTPNPRNGTIVRDARTGEPTGALKDAALGLVARALPELTEIERIEGLEAAIGEAHRAGITSVHSVGDAPDDLELYQSLRAHDGLRLRIYSALAVPAGAGEDDLARLETLREQFPDDPLLKAGGAVVTLSAGGTRGTARELDTLARLDARGWQLFVAPPAGEAVARALDALDAVRRTDGSPDPARRDRLEGVTGLTAESASRLSALDVTASLQPAHEAFDGTACARAARAGARFTFGSGWPDTPAAPLGALRAALPETEESRAEAEGPQLTLEQAVEAHTLAAAWSSFDEQRKGRLARGMLADIVILTSDIFRPRTRLAETGVDTTIFDGKVVYTRSAVMGTH